MLYIPFIRHSLLKINVSVFALYVIVLGFFVVLFNDVKVRKHIDFLAPYSCVLCALAILYIYVEKNCRNGIDQYISRILRNITVNRFAQFISYVNC